MVEDNINLNYTAMMYASPIEIKRDPQQVRYSRKIELPDGLLTIEDITKHLKEGEKFYFFQREEGALGLPVDYIGIQGTREETTEELIKRVEKQEKYMVNYHKHHAKYGKK